MGSDPEDGDLIYFDASGIGYSDHTVRLGAWDVNRQQLERLEGQIIVTPAD